MIDNISWLAVYPEIILMVMGCVIVLADLGVSSFRRTGTYVLTMLTLAVVAIMQAMYAANGNTVYGNVSNSGWAGLYVGDISQPRGGPMDSGHQSHQMGLDIDIWLLPPKSVNLSRAERESISSKSVKTADQRNVNDNWTLAHMAVIRAAAEDPAVDRIFLSAPAKIWMCNNAKGNRKWLQKVRPWWGHDAHFHVRLKCPEGSRDCKTQTPTVSELSNGGTGCDASLNWWVTDALKPPPPPDPNAPKRPKKRGPREYVMADLPAQCSGVLRAK